MTREREREYLCLFPCLSVCLPEVLHYAQFNFSSFPLYSRGGALRPRGEGHGYDDIPRDARSGLGPSLRHLPSDAQPDDVTVRGPAPARAGLPGAHPHHQRGHAARATRAGERQLAPVLPPELPEPRPREQAAQRVL